MVKLKMKQLNCSILLWNLIRWERVLYYLSVLKINFQKKITINTNSPVIGIGSGQALDGQVAVIYDLLGISFNNIDQFTSGNTKSIDRQILKFKKTLR